MVKLYKHQQEIVNADPKRSGIFLGTGSGKSRICLLLARGKVLVIAPKTQVEDQNWEREYRSIKLDPDLHVEFDRAHLTVISKETFRRDHKELGHFDTVIVDEAHTCLGVTPNTRQRNKQPIPRASQLFEALASYLERTAPERLYLCTATIVKNPMTVWAAKYLLDPLTYEEMIEDFFNFRTAFYDKLPMPGREVWAPKRTSKVKDALAVIVRSLGPTGRLEDFFDVPEQTFKTIPIELTGEQNKRIKALRLEYPDPIVLLGKRHQVENGVLMGDEYSPHESFDNNKIEKILDLAAEFPRLVIFAKYTRQIDDIRRALREAKFPNVLVLEGATKDRGELIAEANELEECVFIAQAQISAGWELPAYPCMVFASRTYSFVDYSQALGRIQRANNIKKNLYINLVVEGGVDEAVDDSLANKQDFDERIYLNV